MRKADNTELRVGSFQGTPRAEQEIAHALNAGRREQVEIWRAALAGQPCLQISFQTWSAQADRSKAADILVELRASEDGDLQACDIKDARTRYVMHRGDFNKRDEDGGGIARPSSSASKTALLRQWQAQQESMRQSSSSRTPQTSHGAQSIIVMPKPGQLAASESDARPVREEAAVLARTETALDKALGANDIPLARHLLAAGADPLDSASGYRSQEMRELLVFAHRRNLLYPPSVVSSGALDDALRGADLTGANRIFDAHAGNREIAAVWADAVDSGRLDVQRAILLLGHGAGNRDFRLRERSAPTDPGVKKVMNEIAHFLPELGPPAPSNQEDTRGSFEGTTEAIVCTSLAKDVQECQAAGMDARDYMSRYASKESISRHIPKERFIQCTNQQFYGDAYLVAGRDFGSFKQERFLKMREQGLNAMHMLFFSAGHVWNLSLKLEQQGNEIVYRTETYDPNYSTNHLHSETTSLQALKLDELDSHLVAPSDMGQHFREGADEAKLRFLVRPEDPDHPANALSLPHEPVAANRGFRNRIPAAQMNGPAMWHMLNGGYAADIRDLMEEIDELPERKQHDILRAAVTGHRPGLDQAKLQHFTAAVDAYNALHEHVRRTTAPS